MITKRRLLQSVAASLCGTTAWAQQTPSSSVSRVGARAGAAPGAWPSQPVRVLVGFPPGASPDLAARESAPQTK